MINFKRFLALCATTLYLYLFYLGAVKSYNFTGDIFTVVWTDYFSSSHANDLDVVSIFIISAIEFIINCIITFIITILFLFAVSILSLPFGLCLVFKKEIRKFLGLKQ